MKTNMMKQNPPATPHEVDWGASLERALMAGRIMTPTIFPKIAAAIELEKANKGAGETPFKIACREVIDDEQLIQTMWNSILASLMNPLNGYCW
jgi:hypothetical protein